MNKLTEFLIKPFLDEAAKVNRIIAVYPGRFQPASMHHVKTYEWIVSKFGRENTYVVTSDKVELPKSPLNFQEKKQVWIKHGVPSDHIVQVKNPYIALELMSKLNIETTSAVFVFGEKDLGRISMKPKKDGSPAYFQPYEQNKDNLLPIKEHGYILIAPHVSINIGGKPLDGTLVRTILGSAKLSDDKKKIAFEKIFGWFDEKIYKMLIQKFSQSVVVERQLIKLEERYKKVLIEGGAFGHLENPAEDVELKFGDLKKIIKDAFGGKIQFVEKTDGINIMISWKNGKLIAARNKGHLKNFGEKALDSNALKQMFAGRGNLSDAISKAIDDLEAAISKLSDKEKQIIFGEGKRFMNTEIISPNTQNVIPYGSNILQFHGTVEYDENGEPIGHGVENAGKMLSDILKKINADVQNTFQLRGPNVVSLMKVDKQKSTEFVNKVNQLISKLGLSDSNTIGDYYKKLWTDLIVKKAKELNYDIPKDILELLVNRWAFFDKTFKLSDAKKQISNPEFLKWVIEFDKNEHEKKWREFYRPLELLVLQIGVELLNKMSGFIGGKEGSEQIKAEIQKIQQMIKQTGTPDQIKKLEYELERLNAIGGLDKIIGAEGVVFNYGGKLYKFTGAFAPSNMLLGILKFAR